ncbi:unnamed protein product [Darwinula stevensoni]|uniref:Uncharacterized protein n=1 Tax=Darwinula stevensoni TaxID=69355 RepID=A0A7R9A277_9CRUS|nr:unnamed protein product [Darwinula stevensoni]CAG0878977.1 unnamed protein product [Darwinula stevensoni]
MKVICLFVMLLGSFARGQDLDEFPAARQFSPDTVTTFFDGLQSTVSGALGFLERYGFDRANPHTGTAGLRTTVQNLMRCSPCAGSGLSGVRRDDPLAIGVSAGQCLSGTRRECCGCFVESVSQVVLDNTMPYVEGFVREALNTVAFNSYRITAQTRAE